MSNLGENFSQAGVQLGITVLTGRCPTWDNSSYRQVSNLKEQFSQAGGQLWGNSSHRQVYNLKKQFLQAGVKFVATVLSGMLPTLRNSFHMQVPNLGEQFLQAGGQLGEQF
jgi:hypothetical protein